MAERDLFLERVIYYTEATHDVTDPEAKITLAQGHQLFRAIEEVASAAEFDTSDFEDEEFRALTSEEELIGWLQLRSSDSYNIFGNIVFVISSERLNDPSKTVKTEVLYPMRNFVLESEETALTKNQETRELSSKYLYRQTKVTPRAARRLMEFLGVVPLGTPSEADANEEERAGEAAETDPCQELTQANWAKFMSLLDLIKIMKELGITSTDQFNW